MTVNDVRKPAWRAFEFLMNAGDERLPVSGFVSPVDENSTVSVLAIRNSSTAKGESLGVNIYVANYHRLGNVNRCVQSCALLDSCFTFLLVFIEAAIAVTRAIKTKASVFWTPQGHSQIHHCAAPIVERRTATAGAPISRKRSSCRQIAHQQTSP